MPGYSLMLGQIYKLFKEGVSRQEFFGGGGGAGSSKRQFRGNFHTDKQKKTGGGLPPIDPPL